MSIAVGLADAQLGFAVAAGMVAAFNPCGFAMLPAYLSFFLSGAEPGAQAPVARASVVALAMTAGFMALFGLAGLVVEVASVAVAEWGPWLTMLIGAALVPLGVAMLLGHEVSPRLPRLQRGGGQGGVASMALFGASYATVSLSCTLPVFLTAVAGSFSDGQVLGGLATYLAYAAGMGLVVATLTVALALARDGLVRRMRSVVPGLNRVAGAFLVVAGAHVAYYGYYEVRTLAGEDAPSGPVRWVTGWSAAVTERLSTVSAEAVVAVLAALIASAGVAARRRPRRRGCGAVAPEAAGQASELLPVSPAHGDGPGPGASGPS